MVFFSGDRADGKMGEAKYRVVLKEKPVRNY